MLILASSPEVINQVVKVKVNDEVFSIRMIDEVSGESCFSLNSARKHCSITGVSSNNSDSMGDCWIESPGSDCSGNDQELNLHLTKDELSNSNSGC